MNKQSSYWQKRTKAGDSVEVEAVKVDIGIRLHWQRYLSDLRRSADGASLYAERHNIQARNGGCATAG